jgi:hypothetical protein
VRAAKASCARRAPSVRDPHGPEQRALEPVAGGLVDELVGRAQCGKRRAEVVGGLGGAIEDLLAGVGGAIGHGLLYSASYSVGRMAIATRQLGTMGPEVSAIGLGCMPTRRIEDPSWVRYKRGRVPG